MNLDDIGDLHFELKRMVEQAVREAGKKDVYHPELGWIVKDGKPTHALFAVFKKLQRKRMKKNK